MIVRYIITLTMLIRGCVNKMIPCDKSEQKKTKNELAGRQGFANQMKDMCICVACLFPQSSGRLYTLFTLFEQYSSTVLLHGIVPTVMNALFLSQAMLVSHESRHLVADRLSCRLYQESVFLEGKSCGTPK